MVHPCSPANPKEKTRVVPSPEESSWEMGAPNKQEWATSICRPSVFLSTFLYNCLRARDKIRRNSLGYRPLSHPDSSLWVRSVSFDDRRTRAWSMAHFPLLGAPVHSSTSWIPDPIFWYWVSTSFIASSVTSRSSRISILWPRITYPRKDLAPNKMTGHHELHGVVESELDVHVHTWQSCQCQQDSDVHQQQVADFPKTTERRDAISLTLSLEKLTLSSAFVIAALSSALILSSNCFLNSLSFFPFSQKTEIWRFQILRFKKKATIHTDSWQLEPNLLILHGGPYLFEKNSEKPTWRTPILKSKRRSIEGQHFWGGNPGGHSHHKVFRKVSGLRGNLTAALGKDRRSLTSTGKTTVPQPLKPEPWNTDWFRFRDPEFTICNIYSLQLGSISSPRFTINNQDELVTRQTNIRQWVLWEKTSVQGHSNETAW